MTEILLVIFRMSIQASILIAAVIMFRACFKKYPRIYIYFLWLLVYIRLLCPVFIESSFSLLPESTKIVQENIFADLQTMEAEDRLLSGNLLQEAARISTEQKNDTDLRNNNFLQKTDNQESLFKGRTARKFLLYLWLSGSLVMLLFRGIQFVGMKRKVSAAVHTEDNIWECDNINSPFVIGVFHPRIYMPYGIEGKKREYILLHERMHIRHLDVLVKWIGSVILCIYWWNPFVWTALFLMNDDMEMVCDESVLKVANLEMRKEYSNILLDFSVKRSSLLTGVSFGKSKTEKRIRHILKYRKPGLLLSILLVLGILICAVCFLTVPRDSALIEETDITGDSDENEEEEAIKENSGTEGFEGNEEEAAITESGSQEELFQVMDRIISDGTEIISFSENSLRGDNADRRVLLAELQEQRLTAYGCISPEFNNRGVILEWNGNYTYLDEYWVTKYGEAQLFMADYDKDGRDEAAFSFLWEAGTGLYVEKLLMLETDENGHMEAYEFTGEEQLTEMERMLAWEVDDEKNIIQIKEKENDRLIQTLSYAEYAETEEDITITGIDYTAQVRFLLGEEIILNSRDGIVINGMPILYYDIANGEKSLNFPVRYDYSNDSGEGEFSLDIPRSYRQWGDFVMLKYDGAGIDLEYPAAWEIKEERGEDGNRIGFLNETGETVFWMEQGEEWRVDLNRNEEEYQILLEESYQDVEIMELEKTEIKGYDAQKLLFSCTVNGEKRTVTRYIVIVGYAFYQINYTDSLDGLTIGNMGEAVVDSIIFD